MGIDVVTLLRELDVMIADGPTQGVWLLRPPGATPVQVELEPATERINAHTVRAGAVIPRLHTMPRRLFVGRTITSAMLKHASAGTFDALTEEPLRLVFDGTTYTTDEEEPPIRRVRSRKRPAWIRWATERYLALTDRPVRQREIAESIGTSQQAVSKSLRHLASLVTETPTGIMATDRSALLDHWLEDYGGPRGQEFGWYSLDHVVEQTLKAADAAELLEAHPLISGDVAADHLAPWKLPSRGLIYVEGPIDLAGDGFVPSPLEEATLITCVPEDPTLIHSAGMGPTLSPGRQALADAATVCWDVLNGGDVDSVEAAEHLKAVITRGDV